jgi:hypothetical protein
MTGNATSASDRTKRVGRGLRPGAVAEVCGGLLLAGIFGLALYISRDWEGTAGIFPRGVSGLGLLLALAYVGVAGRRRNAPPPTKPQSVGDAEEDGDDQLEYAFNSATRREWAVSLGYFFGFFAALYLVGLYLTAGLFTLGYLRLEARRSWMFAAAYTAVLVGVLYIAFSVVLRLPVPAGVLAGF